MKEIIVIIFIIILMAGIIINYNIQSLKFGTNLIIIGIMGILLVGLYNKNNNDNKTTTDENKANDNK